MLEIEWFLKIPVDGVVKRSTLDSFVEAPNWKWFRFFPRIWRALWNSFLSRINSRSKHNGDLFFVEMLLPSRFRWPRMWLDCPVLLSKESPHNGQAWVLFRTSGSDSNCNAAETQKWKWVISRPISWSQLGQMVHSTGLTFQFLYN